MKFTLLKRLTLGYVVILLLVVLLGVYVSLNLNLLNRLIRGTAVDGTTIAQMEHLRDTLFSQVSFEKKYLISKDQDFFRKFWEIQEYVIQDMKKLEIIYNSRLLYTGAIVSHPKVTVNRAKKIRVSSDEDVNIEYDGEMGQALPAEFEIIEKSLNFRI